MKRRVRWFGDAGSCRNLRQLVSWPACQAFVVYNVVPQSGSAAPFRPVLHPTRDRVVLVPDLVSGAEAEDAAYRVCSGSSSARTMLVLEGCKRGLAVELRAGFICRCLQRQAGC